jgi:hypothetical protein
MVKRYRIELTDSWTEPFQTLEDLEGDFVKYSDHELLQDQSDLRIRLLEESVDREAEKANQLLQVILDTAGACKEISADNPELLERIRQVFKDSWQKNVLQKGVTK